MSPSFSQAIEALNAQAQSLIAITSDEVDSLREELEQERRFRRHLEAAAATRAHEWAAREEDSRQARQRLEAELAGALEGRRLAEAEVERFHEAVRQQIAIAEQEQTALEEAERERERQREAQLAQRLQEAAAAAAQRECALQEAAERQRQALLQEREAERRQRQRLERRLAGVRQAVLDLLAPTSAEDGAEDGTAEAGASAEPSSEDGASRLALRKVLVPRPFGPFSQPALS
ncbi:hypothetical protein [Synechococcus sp. CCY 9618]|uniref:hypothetical protein n=1 Tax=Synechococcus sp. CCY 9618 TaxID=2815602 RepID=UPI001C21146D|nr:hypothetical protein [Synechococcus sp. CCY 9618]